VSSQLRMAGLTARVMAVSIAEGESTLEELMGESGFHRSNDRPLQRRRIEGPGASG